MRIPSQLHGESLYARKSTHRAAPSAGSSWRRVIRLSLVLVLIVLVMRQVARPGVYEVFFPESPHLASTSGGQQVSQSIEPSRPADAAAPAPKDEERQSTLSASGVETKSIESLTRLLAAWLRGEGAQMRSSEPQSSEAALTIQHRLIGSAIDGSVWRAADGPGLYATLAMHDPDRPRFRSLAGTWPAPVVAGLLPLLQQPDVYRGKSLLASGELVRIEKITAPENSFAIERYWNLWLLPEDHSERPWLVVVPVLPVELRGLVSDRATAPEMKTDPDTKTGSASESDPTAKQIFPVASPRPNIQVVGEFVKRLSYQSEAGAELTPVVAGHIESLSSNGNPIVSAGVQTANPDQEKPVKEEQGLPMGWVLIGSSAIGVLLAVLVMWRTAVQHRYLRKRRHAHSGNDFKLGVLLFLATIPSSSNLSAQSLADLLPGFDAQQMQVMTQDAELRMGSPNINIDEIAKLVFRIDRLSSNVLQERVNQSASPAVVGDAVKVDAKMMDAASLPVSTNMQDYLDLHRIEMLQLEPVEGVPRILFSNHLPDNAAAGDRVSGVAVRLRTPTSGSYNSEHSNNEASMGNPSTEKPDTEDVRQDALIVDVAGRLRWTPAQPSSLASEVLASAGVDLSRLDDVKMLDRQPLSESDSPVFYPMIGAARMVSGEMLSNRSSETETSTERIERMREAVKPVAPVDLLRNPSGFTGDWIRLDVESVRITRVAVESAERQREIGGEFYYEIDAIGDLGNVELQLEVPGGEPVVIDNRYPVTVVSPTLPSFLSPIDSTAEQIVITEHTAIRVEGFFYRLWSYESDLMEARGGKQFAPLIVAGVITDRAPTSSDPLGVELIGKIAAVSVLAAILGAIIYHFINRRGDRESRRRRFQSD